MSSPAVLHSLMALAVSGPARAGLLLLGVLSTAAATGDDTEAPGAVPDASRGERVPLEAAAGDAAPADPALDQPFVLDRFEAVRTYKSYMESRQFQQAADAAELALSLSEEEFGPEDPQLVPVLNDLGTSLLRSDRPAEAAERFERSVRILDDHVGIFAEDLVEPLVGLGRSRQEMGDHEGAIGSFQRAQHVTHRVKGVGNLEQVAIIDSVAESFMALDKWTEAENLQLTAYKLYRRHYGKESLQVIPAMHRLARWYRDIQDFREARIIYRRTLRMLEEAGLEDTPQAIPALRGIALAYLAEGSADIDNGLRRQQDIVRIAEANAATMALEDRIQAHLELGDWYVMMDHKDEEAWEQYRVAWELSQGADENTPRDWQAYFSRPQLIHPGYDLSVDFMGYYTVGREVYYDFEFTVARSGEPEDINVLGTNLHAQTRSAAIHAFRNARFRPAIVDGTAVATPGYKIRRIYPTLAPDDYGAVQVGGGQRIN